MGAMRLTASIGPAESPLETRELEIEAASYIEARDMLAEQIPEGWRVVWFRTRRD
jgi:hypothetical protein